MAGNTFGVAFRVTTAGESHGPANVAIVDGCPAGLPLEAADFEPDLARRRPGQSRYVSARDEPDRVEILSGVHDGATTGAPIALLIRSQDAKSRDYAHLARVYRPGHADFTYDQKYGRRDPRGGGRASARETVVRVAAAVVAKKLLASLGVEVLAWVRQIADVVATVDPDTVTREAIDAHPLRCPDAEAVEAMAERVEAARRDQDSVGGVAELVARGVPAGFGEPVFDKLKADLAKAAFSLPAVVGFETGRGFEAARMRGSAHNDAFVGRGTRIVTATNDHGGTLGGISTGMPIVLRAAVKPTSSIPQTQSTVDVEGAPAEVRVTGRHDPCLLPRFIPMFEAMVALVLADHGLRRRADRL